MAQLIYSADVYADTEITWTDEGQPTFFIKGKNLGSLPTLFDKEGRFIEEVNSYFFYLKNIKKLKDINSNARALLKFWSFIEENELSWNHFPPLKRLKSTYLFRSYLLTEIEKGSISQSTSNTYINHIKNFYLWAIHEGLLQVKNDQCAPFKIETVKIINTGILAHLRPAFTVDTSDLRIRVEKDSQTKKIRALTPLSIESLTLLTQHLPRFSIEFQLQCLLAIQMGLRIQEVSTLTVEAINTAVPLTESKYRYEIVIGPSTGVRTKNNKTRQIEISVEFLAKIRNYLISERRLVRLNKLHEKIRAIKKGEVILKKEKLDIFMHCEKFEPLFISEQGNPVDKSVIGSRWGELRHVIRNKNSSFSYRFHDLRSTYGTYRLNDLLEAGIQPLESLELLMGWMGHINETTTWKYLRFLKRKEVFIEKFGTLDSIMHEAIGVGNE
ncbi:tyrosine-type recombinase/integrase [Motilimonas cestriensis]|uniref:Site-specific integrase n=1 Tax=Motilimonas cestriensis TaxID=2742685 RepID=A0ABS8WC17_9GAMM|nr:site-specific integrase [Motilimonas cestriensis]MCE2595862.1 site-specific integrase [Motilimonas cestriensis]